MEILKSGKKLPESETNWESKIRLRADDSCADDRDTGAGYGARTADAEKPPSLGRLLRPGGEDRVALGDRRRQLALDAAPLVGVDGVPEFGPKLFNVLIDRHGVVSLTFVKDDARGHGGSEGSRSAKRPAEPACGGADFVEAEGTGAEAKLEVPQSLRPSERHGTLGRTEQSPVPGCAPGKPEAGSMPGSGFIQRARSPALAAGFLRRGDQASRFGRFQIRA